MVRLGVRKGGRAVRWCCDRAERGRVQRGPAVGRGQTGGESCTVVERSGCTTGLIAGKRVFDRRDYW